MIMKYEDLLTRSKKSLKDLCKFLCIEFQEKLLEFRDSDLTSRNDAFYVVDSVSLLEKFEQTANGKKL